MKEELGTGIDNERFESPGSDPELSKSSRCATMGGWIDGEASCSGRQSRLAEVYGGEVYLPELAASRKSAVQPSYEMYDVSAPAMKMPLSVLRQRQSSPKLLHPIYPGSGRCSLWHRRRGGSAIDSRHSDAKDFCDDWLNANNLENTVSSSSSSSSWGVPKPDGGLHSVLVGGNEVPTSNASSENFVCSDEPKHPYPSWTSIAPRSHITSPDILASTADSPVLNTVFPGSLKSGLASSPSDMFSPISSIAKYGFSQSNVVSPVSATRDGSNLGTVQYHEEDASGCLFLGLSPLQSTPKELDTFSPFTSFEPCLPVLRPVSDSMEVEASEAQRIEDDIPHQSLYPFHSQFIFEESHAPSFSDQIHQLILDSSDSEGFVQSNYFNESSESKGSPSMVEMTQIDTSRSVNPILLPSVSSSEYPPKNFRMDSSFQTESDISQPLQHQFDLNSTVITPLCTRPTTGFRAFSFSQPFNSRTSVVAEPTIQRMEAGDSDTWNSKLQLSWEGSSTTSSRFGSTNVRDARAKPAGNSGSMEGLLGMYKGDGNMQEQNGNIQDLQRSSTGQSLYCSNLQLQSPLDNHIAIFTSGLDSTGPQRQSNDDRPQHAAQQHSRGFAHNQAHATKALPHCFNHKPLLVSNSAPKQIQVEELRDLFRIVNSELMQRTKLLPELWSHCNKLLAPTLFERGVETFKEYICGRFVQTLEDVFAFIHLAFAAAFLLHWQHDFYSWNTFFDDALQWQHTLSDNEDKVLFLKAMDRWWLPELETTPLFNSFRNTNFGCDTPRGSIHCVDQKILSDVLKHSEVFRVCTSFLDGKSMFSFEIYNDCPDFFIGFEEADISERNIGFPDEALAFRAQSRTWKVQHMIKNITQPLQQERGIEALRRIVIDSEYQIDRGLLQNPREVEVTLITSGRVSS